MYKIMGKLKGCETEEIDSAETAEDAEYLLGEYQLAFGSDWKLWVERD